MTLTIEKFPDLVWQGKRLIWDSRQLPDGRAERVFVPQDYVDEKVRAELLARTNAEFVTSGARAQLGEEASLALGNPASKLCVVAVTGTNGKTSSAQILRRLFVAAGHATAEIGTLGVGLYRAGQNTPYLHLETGFTTPEAPTLHHLFAQLLRAGITHVAMEASSHAMELGRIAGVDFDGALFTNLTQDHLDFHGTMSAYERAKASLFTRYLPRAHSTKRKCVVINAGDAAGARILAHLPLGIRAEAFVAGKTFKLERNSLAGLRIVLDSGDVIESSMVGDYNAENLVGAVLLAGDLVGDEHWMRTVHQALSSYTGPTGRMEKIPSADGRYVFVDYAHTPDALEKALRVLQRSKAPGARLSVVFGCGGDRDKTKRPIMGKLAHEIADEVVVTSDNPRTENPQAILDDILTGIPDLTKVRVEADRRVAIRGAIARLHSGDVCLVAGKGHETYQIVGQQRLHFSDAEECRAALASTSTI
ncbi:MAG: UDP-N-acetylmuramoyl-L-alanyl-D-glutamate--2,6-diaminopimelate ligase [Bdellovibrionales bacterium]|nr:UDP-N-acetylmuramoyl-L-alanyl-D-glutamate--2,6-diaminopimelate ligase [Bdellovibrionales bacterium]